MRMNKVAIGTMRPNFLILTPACVALGIATAWYAGAEMSILNIAVILVGAIAAHASVNALNEYSDFKSGLDLITVPTPFSGGTKTLPNNPDKANIALVTGLVTLGITCAAGLYFLFLRGVMLLPLGVLGVIIILTYTKWINRMPVLCLIAPGLGFGPMMVMGTHFALTGSYNWASFFASLVPFFLVSDLLLLNQFPDAEADKTVGRRHLLITKGAKASAEIYVVFLFAAFLAVIVAVALGYLPLTSLAMLVLLVLAVDIAKGVIKNAQDIPSLIPYMGKNVMINIIAPILLAAGIAASRFL
jgi:1,4-dihydroxy-2-naphthoate octaprenyltransferase